MSDDKPPAQVNVFPQQQMSIDYGALLMSTRDLAVKTDQDLRSFKEDQLRVQSQMLLMFGELKGKLNEFDGKLLKQTVILTVIIVVLALLSKAKLPEIFSAIIGG